MPAIIVIGLARSGKDTAADIIAEEFGFRKFVFSDFIAEEAKKRGLPATKENLSNIGDELRKKEGMDVFAKRLWEKAKGKEKLVLVGPRSKEEVDYIKANCENVVVVRINASPNKRFERRSKADAQERKAFLQRDEIDIERKGFGKVLEESDFKIENDGSPEDLREKAVSLVKGILKKK